MVRREVSVVAGRRKYQEVGDLTYGSATSGVGMVRGRLLQTFDSSGVGAVRGYFLQTFDSSGVGAVRGYFLQTFDSSGVGAVRGYFLQAFDSSGVGAVRGYFLQTFDSFGVGAVRGYFLQTFDSSGVGALLATFYKDSTPPESGPSVACYLQTFHPLGLPAAAFYTLQRTRWGAPNYFLNSPACEIRLYCRSGVALLTSP